MRNAIVFLTPGWAWACTAIFSVAMLTGMEGTANDHKLLLTLSVAAVAVALMFAVNEARSKKGDSE